MARLGLRIGEVARLMLASLDFAKRRLYLVTEKTAKGDTLYLHDEIFPAIKAWVEARWFVLSVSSFLRAVLLVLRALFLVSEVSITVVANPQISVVLSTLLKTMDFLV